MTIDESKVFQLNGDALTGPEVVAIAREHLPVTIGDDAKQAIAHSRAIVESRFKSGIPTYGINTGFGALSTKVISKDECAALQFNLLRSHAASVGEPLEEEIVRGMMGLLAASLCRGKSGIREVVVTTLVSMLNNNVVPVIPSRGSVGASGDLSPLAHLALVLCGEGEAFVDGERMSGEEALEKCGIEKIVPQEKEGLALINGTHLMCATAALALSDIASICEHAVIATAMSIDAAKATDTFLDDRIHAARGQSGQRTVAETIRKLLDGSEILASHAQGDPRVQDPYSFRCSPQVLGASMEAIARVTGVIQAELGAVTDNPLVFTEEDDILSGGNFHGMPLAIAMDELRISLCHIAGIAERRIEWLLSGRDIHNELTPFLAKKAGVESGLMIVQYTAAACCAELRTLSMPASVSNISTSAGIEDYNSMGATAGFMLRQSIELCKQVIAIELLVSSDALDFYAPLQSGAGVENMRAKVRSLVPERNSDRSPSPDIAKIVNLI